jgi:hypothetical protein
MADSLEDFFDEPEPIIEPPKPPRRRLGLGCFLNLLSGILVAATLVVGLLFAIIFINPQSSINPLPPTTLPALVLTWTPSPTPKPVLPATWTPTIVPSPTATDTPVPSDTPSPTPEESPIPTADLESGTTFGIQDGYPLYIENTVNTEAGCNWLGVAGQIFDSDGVPVDGILVETGGSLGDIDFSGITLTGQAPAYGEGGYEITLNDSPVNSEGIAWIRLIDQASLPLSEQIFFETFDSCDSNLIRINFVQISEE